MPSLRVRGRLHRSTSRRRRLARWTVAMVGLTTIAVSAMAAGNWVAGLNSGSSAQAQSATISNLSIAASSASLTNLLYPGGTGDVALTITNPNPFPVTITAVNLPTSSTYAVGFSDAGLTTPVGSACDSSSSTVSWAFATGTSGTSHTLSSTLSVGANGSLVVKFTNDATMGSSAPLACAGAYFKMPAFTGIAATGGAATATSGPATDAWTS